MIPVPNFSTIEDDPRIDFVNVYPAGDRIEIDLEYAGSLEEIQKKFSVGSKVIIKAAYRYDKYMQAGTFIATVKDSWLRYLNTLRLNFSNVEAYYSWNKGPRSSRVLAA